MLIEATEPDIADANDDLIFPDHTAFIIQYAENNGTDFSCYFHEDCLPDARAVILTNLQETFVKQRCSLIPNGSFKLKQKGDEVEITII